MSNALLLVGHGSRSEYAEDVLPYYVDFFKGRFDEVVACYLEQEPDIRDALGRIKADRVFVMPLLIAHGYHTRVTIPEALKNSGKEIIYLEPLGRSELIAQLIERRIGEGERKGL